MLTSFKEKVVETFEKKVKIQNSSTPLDLSINDEEEISTEPISADSEFQIGILKAKESVYHEKIIENQSFIADLQEQQQLAQIEHLAEIQRFKVILFNSKNF